MGLLLSAEQVNRLSAINKNMAIHCNGLHGQVKEAIMQREEQGPTGALRVGDTLRTAVALAGFTNWGHGFLSTGMSEGFSGQIWMLVV